jgi:hypothetical protein
VEPTLLLVLPSTQGILPRQLRERRFVDHGTYVAKAYKKLGKAAVDAMYPQDHTHTNLKGAQVVAETFVKAAVCAKDPLAEHVKGKDLGVC